MWNMDHSIASAERGEREARSTNLTNASLLQTSGLTRPAGLVLVLLITLLHTVYQGYPRVPPPLLFFSEPISDRRGGK